MQNRTDVEYKAIVYQESMLGSLFLAGAKVDPVRFSEFLNKNAKNGWRVVTMEKDIRRIGKVAPAHHQCPQGTDLRSAQEKADALVSHVQTRNFWGWDDTSKSAARHRGNPNSIWYERG